MSSIERATKAVGSATRWARAGSRSERPLAVVSISNPIQDDLGALQGVPADGKGLVEAHVPADKFFPKQGDGPGEAVPVRLALRDADGGKLGGREVLKAQRRDIQHRQQRLDALEGLPTSTP